jgi:hypothetical protein
VCFLVFCAPGFYCVAEVAAGIFDLCVIAHLVGKKNWRKKNILYMCKEEDVGEEQEGKV